MYTYSHIFSPPPLRKIVFSNLEINTYSLINFSVKIKIYVSLCTGTCKYIYINQEKKQQMNKCLRKYFFFSCDIDSNKLTILFKTIGEIFNFNPRRENNYDKGILNLPSNLCATLISSGSMISNVSKC